MQDLPLRPQVWQVLVVDDDPLTRTLLRRSLEAEGYQVLEAQNGEDCLTLYKQHLPHLVLLDALMPGRDGFSCCAELVSLQGNSAYVPVLMITGLQDQTSVDRAFDAGAVDFVTKPIYWPILRRRVRSLLEKAHLLRELELANQQLQNLALTDELTGLANRRRFDTDLNREWRRCAREQAPLSLILGDIDSFKLYNDTYGHPLGDACLHKIAKVFHRCIHRPADLAARYGGEEFAIVLPNTNSEGAWVVAERIRQEIWELHLPHRTARSGDRITLSLGVATLIPNLQSSLERLIDAADKALYAAKAERGNCVIVHTPKLATPSLAPVAS